MVTASALYSLRNPSNDYLLVPKPNNNAVADNDRFLRCVQLVADHNDASSGLSSSSSSSAPEVSFLLFGDFSQPGCVVVVDDAGGRPPAN
jgi:hypothetical protein